MKKIFFSLFLILSINCFSQVSNDFIFKDFKKAKEYIKDNKEYLLVFIYTPDYKEITEDILFDPVFYRVIKDRFVIYEITNEEEIYKHFKTRTLPLIYIYSYDKERPINVIEGVKNPTDLSYELYNFYQSSQSNLKVTFKKIYYKKWKMESSLGHNFELEFSRQTNKFLFLKDINSDMMFAIPNKKNQMVYYFINGIWKEYAILQ